MHFPICVGIYHACTSILSTTSFCTVYTYMYIIFTLVLKTSLLKPPHAYNNRRWPPCLDRSCKVQLPTPKNWEIVKSCSTRTRSTRGDLFIYIPVSRLVLVLASFHQSIVDHCIYPIYPWSKVIRHCPTKVIDHCALCPSSSLSLPLSLFRPNVLTWSFICFDFFFFFFFFFFWFFLGFVFGVGGFFFFFFFFLFFFFVADRWFVRSFVCCS